MNTGFCGCFQAISASLRQELDSEVDEMQHLASLGELCEIISVASEESLGNFPVDQLVPTLVSIGCPSGY